MKRNGWLALVLGTVLGLGAGVALAPHLRPLGGGEPLGDPEQRLEAALSQPDVLHRTAALGSLLAELPPESLGEVVTAVEGSRLDLGDPELSQIASWWAAFDPEAALRWTQQEWRAGHGSTVAAVFRTWGQHDPRAAIAAAEKWRFRVQSETGIQKAMTGWLESGQPGLFEYVEGIPDAESRQRAAEVLARLLVRERGAEQAMAWVESLADPKFRKIMNRRVASAVAQVDPDGVAEWARPQVTAGSERPSGLPRRIGTRWIRTDPEAAFVWLASLPAGKDRNEGVAESYRDWLRHDRHAARAWIEAREPEPWSEHAFSVHALAISPERPVEALAIARGFTDETLRNATTTLLLRRWLHADPEAAEAWIADHTVPEDVLERARIPLRIPTQRRQLEARAAQEQAAGSADPTD